MLPPTEPPARARASLLPTYSYFDKMCKPVPGDKHGKRDCLSFYLFSFISNVRKPLKDSLNSPNILLATNNHMVIVKSVTARKMQSFYVIKITKTHIVGFALQ